MRIRRRRGQVLIIAIVLLSVVLALVGAFVSYTGSVRKATNVFSARSTAREAAQAGLEKAAWCLNQSAATNCGGTYGLGFAGETGVSIGNSAYYTTSIANVSNNLRTITSTGYFPSVSKPTSTVVLKSDVGIDTEQASFHYGVQCGEGGFIMGNNAFVSGNIYANGSVDASNGAYVTGDVFVAGGTSLTPEQQELINDSTYEFGKVSPALDIAESFQINGDNVLNKISLFIRKVSTPSDMTVRILADNAGVPSKTVIGTATLSAASVTGTFGWVNASFSAPPPLVGGQTYWLMLDTVASTTKYWQIGSHLNGGYGNGVGLSSAAWNATSPVWTSAGRDFDFKVWTGGNSTHIAGLHVLGNAHANTLTSDTIDKDAYYQVKTGTTVGGVSHPGTVDPGPQDLPISDSQVAQWQADAAAGGTVTGDKNIDGVSNNVGPTKITGNLTITNNGHMTLYGTIYVQGNVNFSNNAVISLASGYGSNSGIIIVDGTVNISNNTVFTGSGTAGSYILVLTNNTSVNPAAPAMNLANNGAAAVFYAPNGMISVANNASLKEVTAFTLNLTNNSSVVYESGLANVNFSSGPGASWLPKTGTTREIH